MAPEFGDAWAHVPHLSLLWMMPAVGAFVLALVALGVGRSPMRTHLPSLSRVLALAVSLCTGLLAAWCAWGFDTQAEGYQFAEHVPWMIARGMTVAYAVGLDGLSLPFVLLTGVLTPLCILGAWRAPERGVAGYMVAFLAMESLVMGSFIAVDLLLFYVFFEAVLIPLFLIIGIWGGAERIYATMKFFVYTLAGSVFLLIAILAIGSQVGSTSMVDVLMYVREADAGQWFSPQTAAWIWAACMVSFAVKLPMWPVHTWLPDAHVQAPTGGSVFLAGVLLKLGGYGIVRVVLPFFPEASAQFAPWVIALGVIAIIYTSCVAFAQSDMKKMIAYSSVAHMGYVTVGLFSGRAEGVDGAVMQMVSHGLVSAGLFLGVGILYDRMHTKDIAQYGGVARTMPDLALVMMVCMLASVGLPGTSGFVGEFLVTLGAFAHAPWAALGVGLGVVLGATYMLRLYKEVFFGVPSQAVAALTPMTPQERVMFIPILCGILVLGAVPHTLFAWVQPALRWWLHGSGTYAS